jgi:hypothetical protein
MTFATFNPSDKSSNVTLSNGNLTMSIGGSLPFSDARTTVSNSTGTAYFEASINGAAQHYGVGVCLGTYNLSTNFNSGGTGACIVDGTGTVYLNGSAVSGVSVGSWTSSSQIVCVAVDFSNRLIWFRVNAGNWNGSGTANPATGTGGISLTGSLASGALFGVGSMNTGFTGGELLTANFGATSFSQSVPSGFVVGLEPNAAAYVASQFFFGGD